MKKLSFLIFNCILCLGLIMELSSCNSTTIEKNNVIIGMANPFYDCNSLEEASEITGFTMTLPEKSALPEWATKTIYRASTLNKKLLEIIYPEDDDLANEIRIRKALTTEKDISGDYNSYDEEKQISIANKNVTVKLNEGKIYLCIWQQGDYAYSLRVSYGADENDISSIINQIN